MWLIDDSNLKVRDRQLQRRSPNLSKLIRVDPGAVGDDFPDRTSCQRVGDSVSKTSVARMP
jgi:hypothetical protein